MPRSRISCERAPVGAALLDPEGSLFAHGCLSADTPTDGRRLRHRLQRYRLQRYRLQRHWPQRHWPLKDTGFRDTARRTTFRSDRSLRTLLSVDQGSKVPFASLPGALDRISCRHRTLHLSIWQPAIWQSAILHSAIWRFALCRCRLLITVTRDTVTRDAHAASRRAVHGLSCPASPEVAGTKLHSQRCSAHRF
jgi:hypothetical protein